MKGESEMVCKTLVNNMPGELEIEGRWVVARLVDGELWFYGCYKEKAYAEQARREVKGVLLWI